MRSDSRYRVDLCGRDLLDEFCAAGARTRSLVGLFDISRGGGRLEAGTRAPLLGPRVMADSFRFLLAGGICKWLQNEIVFASLHGLHSLVSRLYIACSKGIGLAYIKAESEVSRPTSVPGRTF